LRRLRARRAVRPCPLGGISHSLGGGGRRRNGGGRGRRMMRRRREEEGGVRGFGDESDFYSNSSFVSP